jgi:ribosomal protein S18 acetylase RimI-like enzyme
VPVADRDLGGSDQREGGSRDADADPAATDAVFAEVEPVRHHPIASHPCPAILAWTQRQGDLAMPGADDPRSAAAGVIRPALPEDCAVVARIHVQAWRETYPGIVPPEVLDGLSEARRLAQWQRHLELGGHDGAFGLWLGLIEGVPAGFLGLGRPQDQALGTAAEVQAVYVLRQAQRRALGSCLMRAAGRAAAGRSLGLWVLAANAPARAFYERLGGVAGPTKPLDFGTAQVTEIAYRWDDAGLLAA